MSAKLKVSVGQYSDKGLKELNQDYYGLIAPDNHLLASKGIALALADGVSSSEVSQVASETVVKSFLDDYYATSEAWSVKKSAQRILQAISSWLYSQTRNGAYRYNIEKGYVCTFSALVLKSTTAHIFNAGDTRVYRVSGDSLEQLTEDHRVWLSAEQNYLSRAIGMRDHLDLDYQSHPVDVGDTFVLATDGVYEFVEPSLLTKKINQHRDDLDTAAMVIVSAALENGSDDNLSIQIARVEQLPNHDYEELQQQADALPFAPDLRSRMEFDGFKILRELHHSHRSHVYLAMDCESSQRVAIKIPSVELRENASYIESFLMEEWVAKRVDNLHLLKPFDQGRQRNYLYTVNEYIDGCTLNQWMRDNPDADLETVRSIIEQIARGLQALHRQEMLHQDLRPNNILVDSSGTVKIIDFGAVKVAGIEEIEGMGVQGIAGTMQYTAPEYFVGRPASPASDLFSLGVIAYQMLSGRQPYGTQVARATTPAAQRKLVYQSVLKPGSRIPPWIDSALRKAVHPDPAQRYTELSELLYDLRYPNPTFLRRDRPPLLERDPILFWKALVLLLSAATLTLLATHPEIGL